jgi:hypothetical protein
MPLIAPAQQKTQPAIDPKADEILRKMGQTLGAAKTLSWKAHAMTDQVLSTGQKVQVARNQKYLLRRPDRASADVSGDGDTLQIRYDGKNVTIYNARTNSWGKTPAAADVEKTLDLLVSQHGMVIPLADFFFADPYATLIERARIGHYLGDGWVLDTKCHHLAFRQESVDWQIWIEQGEKALPRKMVITYKDSPGYPQFTVLLSDWDLSAKAEDGDFTFTPPAGAKEIDFAAPTPSAPQPAGESK